MPIRELLLPEFDREMAVTRRLLARLPEHRFAWKPHEKSRSLGELAAHIAAIPGWWAQAIVGRAELDVAEAAAGARAPAAESVRDVLERFDASVAAARPRLEAALDAEWNALWTVKDGGVIVFTMPRIAALRRYLLNHSVHHRGQLSVYLRLNNVPLPAIYGPTADEG